jgi:HEAT repeat protein
VAERIREYNAGPKGDGVMTEEWKKERAPGMVGPLVELLRGTWTTARGGGGEGGGGVQRSAPELASQELVILDRYAVAALLGAATDKDKQFRQNVVRTLAAIGRAERPQVVPVGYGTDATRWSLRRSLMEKAGLSVSALDKAALPAGDERILKTLLTASKDEEAGVRAYGAWGLGAWIDQKEVRKRLVEMFEDDLGTGDVKEPEATSMPRTGPSTGNPAAAALEALEPPVMEPNLNDDIRERTQAALISHDEADAIAKGMGEAVLYSKSVDVRYAAALGIKKWKDWRGVWSALSFLQDELRVEKNEFVAAVVCGDLGAMHARSATPLLMEKLEGPGRISEAAVAALGDMGDPTATGALVKRAEKGSGAAVEALGKLGDRSCVPALIKIMETTGRVSAAEALGKLGDVRALEALRKAAAPTGQGLHGSLEVAALKALAQMNDAESIELFIDVMAKRVLDAQPTAFHALHDLKDARVIPALAERIVQGKGNVDILQMVGYLTGQNFDHYNYPVDAVKFGTWWEANKAKYGGK